MRSHWIIWPLLMSFCLQALGQTLILGRFYLHRAEIEQTLCENRLKPELQCHGKCHLKKQLAASPVGDEKEQSVPELRQWVLHLPEQVILLIAPPIGWHGPAFRFLLHYAGGYISEVFHPPGE